MADPQPAADSLPAADTQPAADSQPAAEAIPVLAQRAAQSHVAVVGGGIAGLVAALECAAVGMRVTVFEAASAPGGVVRRGTAAGLTFDAGAESFATRGGHVRALIEDLGLADAIVAPEPGGAWLAGIPKTGAAPLPKGGLLGIPENPFAEDVRKIIGWRGAWRAYVDRFRPVLTVGHTESLGQLVRTRMGTRVLNFLVAPVITGVHSSHPDDIDVDAAAPGLNGALTQAGSLSGGVAYLRHERAAASNRAVAPGSAVMGIEGGMTRLVDALLSRLDLLGAEIRTDDPVEALVRQQDAWHVRAAEGDDAAQDAADESTLFDAVIIATGETTARHLLREHVSALDQIDEPVAPRVEIVTLVLDAPQLDANPRGSGVLTVPGSHIGKALTHSTAKWRWLREAADGRHVVRLSFGAQGEEPATAELSDDDAARLALSEASKMLGVPLPESALLGVYRARYSQSQPGSALGATARRTSISEVISQVAGLGAVGAWLSGTGLAQVVPHARAEADRVRKALLWQ